MTRHTIRKADDERIGDAVVEALSTATDTDPTDLPQLYDVVDLDALDRLFSPSRERPADPQCRVEFTAAGCRVTVRSDGTVVAVPRSDDADARATAQD